MQHRYVYGGIGLGLSGVLSVLFLYVTDVGRLEMTPTVDAPVSVASDSQAEEVATASPQKVVDVQKTLIVEKGDTLHILLLRAGLSKGDVQEVARSMKKSFDQRDLKVGQSVDLLVRPLNEESVELLSLSLQRTLEEEVKLTRNDKGKYEARLVKIPVHRVTKYAEGKIGASFYQAALKQGVPAALVRESIKVLSYDVNWSHDPKVGDPFMMVYDVYENEKGDVVKPGELQYIAFSPGGRQRQMYGYKSPKGGLSYFNQQGVSVVKTFLRTPLNSTHLRITSRFSASRHHPVLGYSRAHKGIDYGACVGTEVLSAAAGVVVKAGRFGDYGNYIRIRHTGGYETAYGHLKSINVRVGESVSQGKVIGRVGMTGLTSGPHLHHEVLFKGNQINPAGIVHMPTAKLVGSELKSFMQRQKEIDRIILSHASDQATVQNTSYKAS